MDGSAKVMHGSATEQTVRHLRARMQSKSTNPDRKDVECHCSRDVLYDDIGDGLSYSLTGFSPLFSLSTFPCAHNMLHLLRFVDNSLPYFRRSVILHHALY